MKTIINIFEKIDRIVFYVAQISIILMMIVMVAEAITRYVFNHAIPGAHIMIENYLMIMITFLSMSYVMKMKGHIKLDFFLHYIPERLEKILNTIYMLLAAGVMFVIGYQATIVAIDNYVNNYTLTGIVTWPIWTQWIWIPIGSFVFTIRLLIIVVRNLQSDKNVQN